MNEFVFSNLSLRCSPFSGIFILYPFFLKDLEIKISRALKILHGFQKWPYIECITLFMTPEGCLKWL